MVKIIKYNRLSELTKKLLNVLNNGIGKDMLDDGTEILKDADSGNTIRLFIIKHNTLTPIYNNIVLYANSNGSNYNLFYNRPTSGKLFDDVQIAIKNSNYSNYEII